MGARATNGKETRTAGLTVVFTPSEKRVIRRAALEADMRSMSSFVRDAAVKAATKVIGQALKAAA